MIGTTVMMAAVIAVSYRYERNYRGWQRANHPLAGSFARVDRMGATYRDRRADLTDVRQVIGEIVRLL